MVSDSHEMPSTIVKHHITNHKDSSNCRFVGWNCTGNSGVLPCCQWTATTAAATEEEGILQTQWEVSAIHNDAKQNKCRRSAWNSPLTKQGQWWAVCNLGNAFADRKRKGSLQTRMWDLA